MNRLANYGLILFLYGMSHSPIIAQVNCEDPDQTFITDCGTVFDLCIDYSSTEINRPVYLTVTSNDDVGIFDPCDMRLPSDLTLLPQNGAVEPPSNDADCRMKYTPNLNFVGLDSFDYFLVYRDTCTDNIPNLCPNGKIWSMDIVYYGPDGLDAVVSGKEGAQSTMVAALTDLQKGEVYSLDGTHLGVNQTEWTFDFSDQTSVNVHTSCSQEILGVDFGYFRPISGCSAPYNDRNTCTGSSRSSARSVASRQVTTESADQTRVYIAVESGSLPIVFTHFLGRTWQEHNLLEWEIGLVYDEEKLILQKSLDGQLFEDLSVYYDLQAGVFQYLDANPGRKKVYYRLKSVALDGELTFSQVLSIYNAKADNKGINVGPVPTRNLLTLSADREIASIVITDLSGRVVFANAQIRQQEYTMYLAELGIGHGSYICQLQLSDGTSRVRRLIFGT